MGDHDSQPPSWVRDLGLFGVIVADTVGYSAAGLGLGYLAWKKLGFPWWTVLITSMAGLALAMWQVYRISQRGETEEK